MDAQKDPIYMGNDDQPLDVDGFWRFLLVIQWLSHVAQFHPNNFV
jgi:hypothetical protein